MYPSRLERLRLALAHTDCDALLIENSVEIFYLTGIEVSTGKLLISQEGSYFIIDGRYIERCAQQTLYPTYLFNERALEECLVSLNIHRLGIDPHQTSYHAFLTLTHLAQTLTTRSHPLELIAIESPVTQIRLIKDADEIIALREAARLAHQGYEYLSLLISEGVREIELASELELFWKRRGARRLGFDPIIAFGPNSSMPHHRAGHTTLSRHHPVLIDIGVVLSHYHSDMTRVVFFGEVSSTLKEIYTIVEEAKAHALAICRPGTLIGDLDRVARAHIASQGYRDYFTHGLGHGVGLEIHEAPVVRETGPHRNVPLQPGMVLTIEPGIYLPGLGGVRLEDTILITPSGYEILTLPA